ncbi:MAG: TetR/AcrR family transcriptional regulator [Candidatus Binataceae bacterium]
MRPETSPGDQNGRSFIDTARRAQIIECAIETIAALGYARASLAQIARRAGISKGVISYHFAGKDELIRQIVTEVYASGEAFMRPRVTAENAARAQLRAYIQTNIEFISAHRMHLIALNEIYTNLRPGKHIQKTEAYSDETIIANLERILRRGQRGGEFREFSTRVMAVTIRRAIDALSPWLIIDPKLDLGSCARELAELFDRATRRSA